MKQMFRKNVINKNDASDICNLGMFKASDFYDYIVKVISIFDNKDYEYQIFNVTDERLPYKNPTSVFVMFDNSKINKNQFGFIRTKGLIEYIDSNKKEKRDFVYFDVNSHYVCLLDEDLNVNLTSYFIKLFPYLEGVIYDLVKYKSDTMIEGSLFSYDYLVNNINSVYTKEIKERRDYLTDEKTKLSLQNSIKNDELEHIIQVVGSSKLDEGTKKMLIYAIDKYRI